MPTEIPWQILNAHASLLAARQRLLSAAKRITEVAGGDVYTPTDVQRINRAASAIDAVLGAWTPPRARVANPRRARATKRRGRLR